MDREKIEREAEELASSAIGRGVSFRETLCAVQDAWLCVLREREREVERIDLSKVRNP